MSQQPTTVEVNILDKEYLVSCPPDARDALRESARHLDAKMREIRATGKVFGTERIAVMAALNITHEMLEQSTMSEGATRLLESMDTRLDEVLGETGD
ncbi:cell division protein ZapA [Marinobacter sp.]|uniref:cell division protein ZapA n=1 Tax=Marinobacter sp. TaxID=50741 RepID=UPI00384F4741